MSENDRRIAAHWLNRQPSRRRQRGTCTVEDCDRPHKALGYCEAHYKQLYRLGYTAPQPIRRAERGRICSVPGCERKHRSHGLCRLHLCRIERGWATPERREP